MVEAGADVQRSTEVSISASEGAGEERGLVEEGSPSSLSNPALIGTGAGTCRILRSVGLSTPPPERAGKKGDRE